MTHFYGFKLNVDDFWREVADQKNKDRLLLCYMMIKHNWTYRQLVENFPGICSIGTLCKWIHKELPSISTEMYSEMTRMFKLHKSWTMTRFKKED